MSTCPHASSRIAHHAPRQALNFSIDRPRADSRFHCFSLIVLQSRLRTLRSRFQLLAKTKLQPFSLHVRSDFVRFRRAAQSGRREWSTFRGFGRRSEEKQGYSHHLGRGRSESDCSFSHCLRVAIYHFQFVLPQNSTLSFQEQVSSPHFGIQYLSSPPLSPLPLKSPLTQCTHPSLTHSQYSDRDLPPRHQRSSTPS